MAKITYSEGLVALDELTVLLINIEAELGHASGALSEQSGEQSLQFIFDRELRLLDRDLVGADVSEHFRGAGNEFEAQFLEGGELSVQCSKPPHVSVRSRKTCEGVSE